MTATDGAGKVLRGILVAFKVSSGGGSMYAGAAITDNRGVAQDWWTLGPALGTQTVDVVAVDPSTAEKQNFGTFTATALAPARLVLTPTSANYGLVAIGATSSATTFTVSNAGGLASGTVSVTLGGASPADYTLTSDTCGAGLAPGASCTVAVTFRPTSTGARSALLNASAAPGGSASANLSGTGTVGASLSIVPTPFNFGNVNLGNSSSVAFTVLNNGLAPAAIVQQTIVGDASFSIVSNGCFNVTLGAQQTCSIMVRFLPTLAGPSTANLHVMASSGAGATAAISGNGVAAAALQIAPISRNYGTHSVGQSSVPQTFTVTNPGSATTGVLTVSITGATTEFIIDSNTCQGATIAPGAPGCTVVVRFVPGTTGPRTATLTVAGTPGGTTSAALSGAGSTTLPVLSITPTSHNFGSVVGLNSSAPQDFTVQNTGGGAATQVSVNMLGTHSADFIIQNDTCDGSPLNAGASCTITVHFTPRGAGARIGTLSVSAFPGTSVAEAQLSGTGVAPAILTPARTSIQFGNVPVGTPVTLSVDITNTGGAVSSPLQLSISGANTADFTIGLPNQCQGATLAPGQSCTVWVTFQPVATGSRSASLTVPGMTQSVLLQGSGLP